MTFFLYRFCSRKVRGLLLSMAISFAFVHCSDKLTCKFVSTLKHNPRSNQTCLIDGQEIKHPNISFSQSEQSVTEIVFKGLNVTCVPETVAKTFVRLTRFEMTQTSVTSLKAQSFSNLSELLKLLLNSNRIHSIDTNAFKDLAKLVTLELYNNRIQFLSPNVFDSLTNLSHLSLSRNKIEFLYGNHFDCLVNLASLWLHQNKIAYLDPKVFHNLVNLKIINLQDNSLIEIAPGLFSNNSKLREIRLNSNRLQLVPLETFDGLHNLEKVRLSKNDCVNETGYTKNADIKELKMIIKLCNETIDRKYESMNNFYQFIVDKKEDMCLRRITAALSEKSKPPEKAKSFFDSIIFKLFFGTWNAWN